MSHSVFFFAQVQIDTLHNAIGEDESTGHGWRQPPV